MQSEIWCFIVCFGMASVSQPSSVDSFCSTYVQIVRSKEELDKVKLLPRAMRDRVQGNDLEYLCRCTEFKSKLCPEKKGNT